MDSLRDKMIIKALIMDSLLARSGQIIAADVIRCITTELTKRIFEVFNADDEEHLTYDKTRR